MLLTNIDNKIKVNTVKAGKNTNDSCHLVDLGNSITPYQQKSIYDYSNKKVLYPDFGALFLSKPKTISFQRQIKQDSFFDESKALTDKLTNIPCMNAKKVLSLIEQHKESKGIIGNIPSEWFENIAEVDRNTLKKDLFEAFGKATIELRAYYLDGKDESCLKEVAKTLNNTFNKLNIAGGDINFEKLSSGNYALTYTFEIKDKKYVLKVFDTLDTESKVYSRPRKFDRFLDFDLNGRLIEPNRALLLSKICPDTNFTKMYFADLNKGYMLSEHASNVTSGTREEFNGELYGLLFEDNIKANIVNGLIVDFGNISVVDPVLPVNETARDVFSKIYYSNDKVNDWYKILEHNDQNEYDVRLGLIKAINCLPEIDREYCFDSLCNMELDDKTKSYIVFNLECVNDGLRKRFVDTLTRNAGQDLKDISQFLNSTTKFAISGSPHHKIELIDSIADNDLSIFLKRILGYNLIMKNVPEELRMDACEKVIEGNEPGCIKYIKQFCWNIEGNLGQQQFQKHKDRVLKLQNSLEEI